MRKINILRNAATPIAYRRKAIFCVIVSVAHKPLVKTTKSYICLLVKTTNFYSIFEIY